MAKNNKKFLAGFTLVEILISSAIISLVAISVYAVFASGVRVWQRGSQASSYERRERLFLEKLGRELSNTFQFSNIPFKGTEDSIAFATLSEKGVSRISYFLNTENVLCRRLTSYAESFKKEEELEAIKLIPGVSGLKFSYCYLDNASGDYKWKDRWKPEEQDTLPRAVSIELIFKRDVGLESKFTKTILIPIGTGEQKIVLSP